MTTVLLAEDDDAIAAPLARALQREGYLVEVVADGLATLARASTEAFDLVVLDLGLPKMDGLEVCRRLRTVRPEVAVLMLTARTDEVDFVVGLDAGADDYVGKPFRVAELMARVRALLRRRSQAGMDTLDVAGVRLEHAARRVYVNGVEIGLAHKEYELLKLLLEHAGQVVTREQILRDVWGDSSLRSSKTLDMHMSWLRRKIGGPGSGAGVSAGNGAVDKRIATIRGVGFRFNTV